MKICTLRNLSVPVGFKISKREILFKHYTLVETPKPINNQTQ